MQLVYITWGQLSMWCPRDRTWCNWFCVLLLKNKFSLLFSLSITPHKKEACYERNQGKDHVASFSILFSGAELLSSLCSTNVKGYSPLLREWLCHFCYQVVRVCYGKRDVEKSGHMDFLPLLWKPLTASRRGLSLSTAIKLLQILNDMWEIDSFFRITVICKKCLLSDW